MALGGRSQPRGGPAAVGGDEPRAWGAEGARRERDWRVRPARPRKRFPRSAVRGDRAARPPHGQRGGSCSGSCLRARLDPRPCPAVDGERFLVHSWSRAQLFAGCWPEAPCRVGRPLGQLRGAQRANGRARGWAGRASVSSDIPWPPLCSGPCRPVPEWAQFTGVGARRLGVGGHLGGGLSARHAHITPLTALRALSHFLISPHFAWHGRVVLCRLTHLAAVQSPGRLHETQLVQLCPSFFLRW